METEPASYDSFAWVDNRHALHEGDADDVAGALSAAGFSNIRILDAAGDLRLRGQVGRSFFLSTA